MPTPASTLCVLVLAFFAACAPRNAARPAPPQSPPPVPPAAAAPPAPAPGSAAPVPCAPAVAPAARAFLSVQTDPPGAMVFWLGKFVGGTPLDRHEVEAGTAQLVLVLPRYEPLFETITVRPAEHALVKLAFKSPAPASPAAAGSPAGASAGGDEASGSGECGWGPCMEECRQDRFDCGSADLCEALYQGCIKRCRRHYHCY